MTLDLGRWSPASPGIVAAGWSVDTRTLSPGDVFFALRGPCHDGHDYVEAARQRGAAAVVVDHAIEGAGRSIVVAETLAALQDLARWARSEWGGSVVAVTGSAGKTSTKDAIAHLLAGELAVGKTVGNFNNHVGLPLSILRLPDECRAAVLEMGMNHGGEIRALARIARPQVGVVTNAGYAHAENFDDGIEGIAAAKRELIEELPPEGVAVLNADDARVARFGEVHRGRSITYGLSDGAEVRAVDVELTPDSSRFSVDGSLFDVPLPGAHAVRNLLAGVAVARVFDIPARRLTESARTVPAGKMRGERMVHNGIAIFNDCYNSNPEAVRSMLDVLGSAPAARRIAVLGEMLELGRWAEPLHREVGSYVAARGIDLLIGIRGAARHMVDEAVDAGMSGAAYFFEDPETAGDFVRQQARPGDAILFKGSRGVAVEKALGRLVA